MGDILSRRDSTILVGVSNSLNPDAVRDDSIHEQLKQRYSAKWLRTAFENGKRIADEKGLCKNGMYPYGYTFRETAPDGRHFAFIVMSEWGGNGFPIATSKNIGNLMQSFFQNDGPGNTMECWNGRLYMPLLGSRVANLKGAKQKYAEWLAREFIDHLETCRVNHLVIVVRPHTLEDEKFHYPELNIHIQSYRDGQHHPENIWAKYSVGAEVTGDQPVQLTASS